MQRGFAHVAIDGPAGSGKTTVARALARRLDVLYLDTGAMYRAVALLALRAGVDPGDAESVLALACARPIRVTLDAAAPFGSRVYAGSDEFGAELHGNDVSRVVSLVSAHAALRQLMVERQRAIAAEGPVIMAGRDIGTVVLPDAPFKIFLTATVDERVERRLAELTERGVAVEPAVLRAQLQERDRLDETRDVAPLRAAADAVRIDSSAMTVEAVVDRIEGLVRAGAA
ncbi:MAG: (d)CMP kinase [Candidatus Eremiobacteraeota bacterium]|nr:(d)CMP kinase [Candidatus Eremiobacteraeota bacterium]